MQGRAMVFDYHFLCAYMINLTICPKRKSPFDAKSLVFFVIEISTEMSGKPCNSRGAR